MTRFWAIPVALLALAIVYDNLTVSGALSLFSPAASAQTLTQFCIGQGVQASPSTVTAPGQVNIIADGFSPGTTVNITATPPSGWSFSAQVQPTADSSCRASGSISILACATCPSGTATVHAQGVAPGGSPLSLSTTFTLIGGSSSNTQPTSIPITSAPQSCTVPSAFTSPTIVPQGGSTTFVASGFSPQQTVNISINGPTGTQTAPTTANTNCQVSLAITVLPTDPPGIYSVTATGPAFLSFQTTVPQTMTQSANYQVTAAAVAPTSVVAQPTATSNVVCPNPSAIITTPQLTRGQQTTFSGLGFRPGSQPSVRIEDPNLPSGQSNVPFFVDPQTGPATTTCAVTGVFTVNPTVPPGHYRLSLTGQNQNGTTVTARADFDVVADQGTVPTPLPTSPAVVVEPTASPTPFPTGPTGGQAPVAITQTLNLTGGPRVPVVGQTNTYDHVIRVTNTSPSALDSGALGALLNLFAASMQGQGINMSFSTDYADTARVVSTSASTGTATVRGTSVVWNGQLQSGESLELRTTLDYTPTTALSLNSPIRGQTVSVSDQRGLSLSLPPPPPPQLPPAQRIVQPPPPPVDPILGDRYFSDTGFAVGDDSIWTYFIRRGGRRTFGAPISRLFQLEGLQVQLFEKGMLGLDADGNVSSVNLLEDPFLPYEAFGDLRLPTVDDGLIAGTPDPSSPTYADDLQEYIRVNTPEAYDGKGTRFYSTFLSTVLFNDAFFDGNGDPNLIPGFDLEIWGLPTSQAGYQVIGFNTIPGGAPDGSDLVVPITDANVVLQRFQRGVMRFNNLDGTSSAAALGPYLKAVITGQVTDPEFLDAASASPLWFQYNSDNPGWMDRPDEIPDSNLELAFEPN